MRLHRTLNRKVGDKPYYKWRLDIPTAVVTDLGWDSDTDLSVSVEDGYLVVRRATDA